MLSAEQAPGVLDLSSKGTPTMLESFISDDRAWVVGSFDPKDVIIRLDDAALAEVARLVEDFHAAPLPLLLHSPDGFDIPVLREVMRKVRENLTSRMGFAVVDALPMDEYDDDDMKTVFWIVGQLIGPTVAQKWDGTMLYDVSDKGKKFGYGVRGSYTNVELVFHTDNAFGVAPPEVVGLLCKNPAMSGGVSRFCSLYSVHNKMLREHPELLRRLYEPMHFDRQAEHGPDAPKTSWVPFFSYNGQKLTARANVQLVRKGYDVAGVEMESILVDALEAIEAVGNSPELWLELPIERGQMQYLNNIELAHYRSDFQDHDDPARKRHLFRTWHRQSGRRTYEG